MSCELTQALLTNCKDSSPGLQSPNVLPKDEILGPFLNQVNSQIYEKTLSVPISNYTKLDNCYSVSWRDGNTFSVSTNKGEILTFNLSGQLLYKLENHSFDNYQLWRNYIPMLSWSHSGDRLAYSRKNLVAYILDEDYNTLTQFYGSGYMDSINWSPDDLYILMPCMEGFVYAVDARNGSSIFSKKMHEQYVNYADWSPEPEGYKVASCSLGEIKIFSVTDTSAKVLTIYGHRGSISIVKWSPDGKRLCSGGIDLKLKLWSSETGEELQSFEAHESDINYIEWSPRGDFLASVSADKFLKIWKTTYFVEVFGGKVHKDAINSVRWNSEGNKLLTASIDCEVHLHEWRSESREPLKEYDGEASTRPIAISPDYKMVASGHSDATVKVWNIESGDMIACLKGLSENIYGVIWNKAGTIIMGTSYEGEIGFWNLEWELINMFQAHPKANCQSHWNHDETKIVSGGDDKKIRIWSMETKQMLLEINGHEDNVKCVQWNKDSTLILSSSADSTIKLWNALTGALILKICSHFGRVHRAIWSADETRIISTGDDRTIRIFNIAENQEILNIALDGFHMSMSLVRDDDNEELLTSSCEEGGFFIWDLKTGALLKKVFVFKEKWGVNHAAEADDNWNVIFHSDRNGILKSFDKLRIWGQFSDYEVIHFYTEYLNRIRSIDEKLTQFISETINYACLGKYSVFHLLLQGKKSTSFNMFLDFCQKKQIYPTKFYDSKEIPLMKLILQSHFPPTVANNFLKYVLASNVELGRFILLDDKDIVRLVEINGLTVCELLKNRFKELDQKPWFADFQVEDIERSSSLVNSFWNLSKEDFLELVEGHHPLRGFSTTEKDVNNYEKLTFFVSDLSIKVFSIEFFEAVRKSPFFDDFCCNEAVLSMLDLLWVTARVSFFKGNMIYFFLLILLIANSLYVFPSFVLCNAKNDDGIVYMIFFLCFSFVILSLLARMIYKEVKEYRKDKEGYYSSIWNWIDNLNILFNSVCAILNYLYAFDLMPSSFIMRIMHALCFFFAMMRLFDFFRAFKQTCFLIEIILQVIIDMKVFFFIMLLVLVNFSSSAYILQSDYSLGLFSSFVGFYKLILGDSDQFSSLTVPESLMSFIFCFCTLFMIVVMLNLLISIIGATYGRVSEVNELTFQKNRFEIITQVFAGKKEQLNAIKDKYLITLYKEDPIQIDEMEKEKNMENNIQKNSEMILRVSENVKNLEKKIGKYEDKMERLMELMVELKAELKKE